MSEAEDSGAPPGWHRLSSRGLSARACEELFWDGFNSNVLRFDWKPLGGRLALEADVRALPGIKLAAGRGMAVAQRTREMIKDGNDDLVYLINLDSRVWITQRGQESSLAPGQAFFGTCTEPFTQAGDLGIGFRLDRSAITHLVPDLDDRVSRFLAPDNAMTRLIIGYIQSLRSGRISDEDAARYVALHIHDLVALAIGASDDEGRIASRRGLSAVRLQAIKQDIAALIGPRRISAEMLAERHGVSPRYVRMLFERDGGSLGDYVQEAQLDSARGMLSDPARTRATISEVAFDVGFSDLSYFNRCFRRRFEMAPGDVRGFTAS